MARITPSEYMGGRDPVLEARVTVPESRSAPWPRGLHASTAIPRDRLVAARSRCVNALEKAPGLARTPPQPPLRSSKPLQWCQEVRTAKRPSVARSAPSASIRRDYHVLGDPGAEHPAEVRAISPVVMPFVLSDSAISPTPVSRHCRFLTICGRRRSPPARSRSRWSWCGCRCGSPAAAAGEVVFSVAEVVIHFLIQRGLQDVLRQAVQQPARADEVDSLSLAWARSSCANSC